MTVELLERNHHFIGNDAHIFADPGSLQQ
ncbi:MAG: hypothetical protein ACK2TV_12685 [Anaerolineales bacterium]